MASAGNDISVRTRRIINSFYIGKGELGRKRIFLAECSANTKRNPGW